MLMQAKRYGSPYTWVFVCLSYHILRKLRAFAYMPVNTTVLDYPQHTYSIGILQPSKLFEQTPPFS